MSKQSKKKIVIESVSYINDPTAAKEWFSIYIEILKKQLEKQMKQKD